MLLCRSKYRKQKQ